MGSCGHAEGFCQDHSQGFDVQRSSSTPRPYVVQPRYSQTIQTGVVSSVHGSKNQEGVAFLVFRTDQGWNILKHVSYPGQPTNMEVDNPWFVEDNGLSRGHAIHTTIIVGGSVSTFTPKAF